MPTRLTQKSSMLLMKDVWHLDSCPSVVALHSYSFSEQMDRKKRYNEEKRVSRGRGQAKRCRRVYMQQWINRGTGFEEGAMVKRWHGSAHASGREHLRLAGMRDGNCHRTMGENGTARVKSEELLTL